MALAANESHGPGVHLKYTSGLRPRVWAHTLIAD